MDFKLYPDKTNFAVELSEITAIAESTTPDKKKKLTIIYIGSGLSECVTVFDKYQEVRASWQDAKDEEDSTINKLLGETNENKNLGGDNSRIDNDGSDLGGNPVDRLKP